MMNNTLVDGGVTVVLVGGITQILKGYIPERFVPLLALVLGGLIGLLTFGVSVTGVVQGLISGLTAAGLYDQKALVKPSVATA